MAQIVSALNAEADYFFCTDSFFYMTVSICKCPPEFRGRDKIDKSALGVVRRLYEAGHTAYFVGGCVRDILLGRTPKDFDIATTARPAQVRRLFGNSRLVGRRFRLAHVCCGKKIIEVSTFRRSPDRELSDYMCEDDFGADDGIILDNTFGTPQEDALRRDFKVNGLFLDIMSPGGPVVIDFVGGLSDIKNKLVSTIGIPEKRFIEDPVRMLRAVKFCAKLGFKMEEKTWNAILKEHSMIKTASVPRVQEEMMRFLELGCAQKTFQLLWDSGLLADLVPGITKFLTGTRYGTRLFFNRKRRFDRIIDLGDQIKFDPGKERAQHFTILVLPMFIVGCAKHDSEEDDWINKLVKSMAYCFGLCRQTQCETVQYLTNLKRMLASHTDLEAAKHLVSRRSFPYSLSLFELLYKAKEVNEKKIQFWREMYRLCASDGSSGQLEDIPLPDEPEEEYDDDDYGELTEFDELADFEDEFNDTYEPEHEPSPEEQEELKRLGISLVPQPRPNIRPKEDLENFVEPDSWRKVHELDEIGIPYELDELFRFDYQDDDEEDEEPEQANKPLDNLFDLEKKSISQVAEQKANLENCSLEELFNLSSAEAEKKAESLPGLDSLVEDEEAKELEDSSFETEASQAAEESSAAVNEIAQVALLPMEKETTESESPKE